MNQNISFPNRMGNWNGNFHGEVQTPSNVVAPPPTPAEKEVRELKEMLFKFMNKDGMNLQALNFQEVAVLPQKFRMPEIKRFNGIGCPTSHLKAYTLAMRTRGATPQMMAANFPLTLEASAQEWIMTLDPSVLINWEKVSELFQARYMDNIKRGNDKKELKNFCMRDGESFTEFVKRWKNKVAQTLERPTRDEEMDMFLNNLKPFYFHKMVCGGYADFDTLMSAGLRIEECLRLGTMKDDTPASGSSYRQRLSTSGDANKANHTSAPSNTVGNISWSPFMGGNVNAPPQFKTQVHHSYVNAVGGNNNQGGGMVRRRDERPTRMYDVLPDSRATIFRLLKEEGVMKPLEGWKPKTNPLPSNWEHGKFCEYHNFSGHDTEQCYILKDHLQDLIEKGVLERGGRPVVNAPNVVNNPLPVE